MSPPGTYFVTFSTCNGEGFFVVERYARLSLKTMYVYRRQGKFQLHTFVLMPEHVHVLLTPAEGVTLERVVRLVKGGYSYAFGMEFGKQKEVWQRGFTDHRIRDRADFEKPRGYIHDNPVAHRLVDRAMEYRYCSACPGFKLDGLPSAAKAAVGVKRESARVELVLFPFSQQLRPYRKLGQPFLPISNPGG